jgi:hypothetical protein
LQTARYRGQRSAWQVGATAPTPPLSAALGLSCRRNAIAGTETLGRWGLPPPYPHFPLCSAFVLLTARYCGQRNADRWGLPPPNLCVPLCSAFVLQTDRYSEQQKDAPKGGSPYSERGSDFLGFDIGRRMSRCPGKRKKNPASHQVSATSLEGGCSTRPTNLAMASHVLAGCGGRISHRSGRSGIIVQARTASPCTLGAFTLFMNGGARCGSKPAQWRCRPTYPCRKMGRPAAAHAAWSQRRGGGLSLVTGSPRDLARVRKASIARPRCVQYSFLRISIYSFLLQHDRCCRRRHQRNGRIQERSGPEM